MLTDEQKRALTVGDFEHFETYITENDIKYIASLGFDHIRLGFDQIVIEDGCGGYRPEIIRILRRFIGWCEKHKLNIVLNLHKAIGNYCDIEEKVSLIDDAELQRGFIRLWTDLESMLADKPNIAFEILNEVKDVDPELWNDLAERTINTLRKLNKDRRIIIGSTCWNNLNRLEYLRVFDDENVIYTFHMYDPSEFTHQRGVLQNKHCFYNRDMPYPGDIQRYKDFYKLAYNNEKAYTGYEIMDKKYMYDILRPAKEFIEKHPDAILWCGEFGTIRHAKLEWHIA